jgi:hypothetical protein
MSRVNEWGHDLLPLRRMAARLGVPSLWLRQQAEAGKVPGLRAGNRWLFRPEVAAAAVRAMAGDVPSCNRLADVSRLSEPQGGEA